MMPEWREANENRSERCVRSAAAGFIEDIGSWQVFDTLTFSAGFPVRDGHVQFLKMCRVLAKRVGEHLDVAWVWGRQEIGTIHFHALFKTRKDSTRTLTPKDFRRLPWCNGAKREIPRNQQSVTKYLLKQRHDLWEVNVICPRTGRCRRTNCVYAPSRWPTPEELMVR